MTPLFGWTPLIAIDIETTSRSTRHGEIVEIAAWRVVEGDGSERVFDTLIKPFGPIGGTNRHGLDIDAVAQAPRIGELLLRLESVLANRMLVAHHAKFVLRHLAEAFRRAGRPTWTPPRHICTMRLARALDLPGQMTLSQACLHLGVPLPSPPHRADSDARAVARLFTALQDYAGQVGVGDLDDLVGRARFFKMTDSFAEGLRRPLWPAPPRIDARTLAPLMPRRRQGETDAPLGPRAQYQAAVLEALAGLEVVDAGLSYLDELRETLGLTAQQAAQIHAQVIAGVEARYVEDHQLDDTEARHLALLRSAVEKIESASVVD